VFDRLHLTFTGSYDNRDYHSVDPTVLAVRRDDIYTLRAELEMSLVRHFTVNVFYQYEKDDTNIPDRQFADNQVGIQGTWKL
jgi:hypothetical protein